MLNVKPELKGPAERISAEGSVDVPTKDNRQQPSSLKRSLSVPQSPLKIEQQQRKDAQVSIRRKALTDRRRSKVG